MDVPLWVKLGEVHGFESGVGGMSCQARAKNFFCDVPAEDSEQLGQGVSSGVGGTTNTGGNLCLLKEDEMVSSL
ncbi:hypothetical protein DSO57_1018279 [Entomophthora muscae]|uniref:Uncharacterized protein n=1 Tax=Entomophthora muscae TaxID=34485 RepID=A0ACC2ST75_9FUNG|nr:hypothetical protein DSO57_1018279 [Entomophthora muscae]